MENERMDNVQNHEPVDAEPSKSKPFWKNTRGIALFVAFVLLFSAIGGYTLAYLSLNAKNDVKNQLALATVEFSVSCGEEDKAGEKWVSNFVVKNEGRAYAYFRVAVIANWRNKDGSIHASTVPKRGMSVKDNTAGDYILAYNSNLDTYTVDEDTGKVTVSYDGYNSTDWFVVVENEISYYYYKYPVPADDKTSELFTLCRMIHKDPHYCVVDFAVQAIQAAGGYKEDNVFKHAVELAWDHVKVDKDGYLTRNS